MKVHFFTALRRSRFCFHNFFESCGNIPGIADIRGKNDQGFLEYDGISRQYSRLFDLRTPIKSALAHFCFAFRLQKKNGKDFFMSDVANMAHFHHPMLGMLRMIQHRDSAALLIGQKPTPEILDKRISAPTVCRKPYSKKVTW